MMTTKSYSDMILLSTFEERLEYLQTHNSVGENTFGPDRWINQRFYKSKEWKDIRNKVIVRDNGCDLAIPELTILDRIYIHHINPIEIDDFSNNVNKLTDLDNLICVSFDTHQAIHYCKSIKVLGIAERKPNDTKVW